LALGVNPFLNVAGKLVIHHSQGVARLEFGDNL
jgi:hypothetical protein